MIYWRVQIPVQYETLMTNNFNKIFGAVFLTGTKSCVLKFKSLVNFKIGIDFELKIYAPQYWLRSNIWIQHPF